LKSFAPWRETNFEFLNSDLIQILNINEYFAGKTILITGASGYLATNLIDRLKAVKCRIIRFSRTKPLPTIKGAAELIDVSGDYCDVKILSRVLPRADIIYHFAAQTSAYKANDEPENDWRANVKPMLSLLETIKKLNHNPIVIFSGTATEVGLTRDPMVDETFQDKPITIYDIHKLLSEKYLEFYSIHGKIKGVTLRLPNVYGPGPKSSSSDRGIINLMIRKAIAGESLTVYGKGGEIRDYIFIDDVINAFLSAAEYIEKTAGQHFVIGSGQGHTIMEAIHLVAERVALKIGKKVAVEHIVPPFPQSIIEERNFIANFTRFQSLTGWKAKWSLIDGINKTIDSFQIDVS